MPRKKWFDAFKKWYGFVGFLANVLTLITAVSSVIYNYVTYQERASILETKTKEVNRELANIKTLLERSQKAQTDISDLTVRQAAIEAKLKIKPRKPQAQRMPQN